MQRDVRVNRPLRIQEKKKKKRPKKNLRFAKVSNARRFRGFTRPGLFGPPSHSCLALPGPGCAWSKESVWRAYLRPSSRRSEIRSWRLLVVPAPFPPVQAGACALTLAAPWPGRLCLTLPACSEPCFELVIAEPSAPPGNAFSAA
jgi:hypothetical protein